jgi:toluene monooxygenase system protein D
LENLMKKRLAGPVLRGSEVSVAVVEAIRADNQDKDILVHDHGAYLRVEAEDGLIVKRDSVEAALGRSFSMQEIELHLAGFSGKIEVTEDHARWFFKS